MCPINCLCFRFVLPDAHGCTYPQVTLLVFDDAAYLLAFQRFRMREVLSFCCSFCQTDSSSSVPMSTSLFFPSQIPFACLSFRMLSHPKSLKLSVLVLRQETPLQVPIHKWPGTIQRLNASYRVVAEKSFIASSLHIQNQKPCRFPHYIYRPLLYTEM